MKSDSKPLRSGGSYKIEGGKLKKLASTKEAGAKASATKQAGTAATDETQTEKDK